MPLYTYKCESCGSEDDIIRAVDMRNRDIFCEKCSSKMKRIMAFTKNKDWFRPFIQEDFNDTPILVESKKHYKELCKKYGVTARCLL